jgi:hypothetical protein
MSVDTPETINKFQHATKKGDFGQNLRHQGWAGFSPAA